MTRVFLSYARDDLQVVQRLEQELVAHGLSVWRDQDSIYGGQHWPKAIGEAIATHDWVVLVWSQHAARSPFVELEWNIALALQTSVTHAGSTRPSSPRRSALPTVLTCVCRPRRCPGC